MRSDQRGNVLIETALTLPLLFTLSAGSFAIGLNLDRYLQAQQLSRVSASILSDRPESHRDTARVEQLIERSAAGTELAFARNRTTVILSSIGLATAGRNRNLPVVQHRFRIGRYEIAESHLGTPSRIAEGGHVADFENDPDAVVKLPAGVALPRGTTIHAAEVIHDAGDLSLPGLLQTPRIYARTFF